MQSRTLRQLADCAVYICHGTLGDVCHSWSTVCSRTLVTSAQHLAVVRLRPARARPRNCSGSLTWGCASRVFKSLMLTWCLPAAQAKPQPVLRGVQPWQRSGAAAAAVCAWARWGATYSNAASLRLARVAHGLAVAGCGWAATAAERFAEEAPGLAPLPDVPIMLVRRLPMLLCTAPRGCLRRAFAAVTVIEVSRECGERRRKRAAIGELTIRTRAHRMVNAKIQAACNSCKC